LNYSTALNAVKCGSKGT